MEDDRLKKLVQEFQAGEVEAGRELLALLYPIIDDYSLKHYGKQSETCYYYVEDMLERFYGIMERYRPSEVLFLTWFNKVIYSSYFNHEIHRLHNELWDPTIIENEIIDDKSCVNNVEVGSLFSCLNWEEKRAMTLRYPDFVDSEKIDLVFEDFNSEVRANIIFDMEAILQKDRIKANSIYDKIISIHQKRIIILKQRTDNFSRAKLLMRSGRIEALKEQKEKLQKTYRERISTLSYEKIAKYLNRTIGSVSSIIHRGKYKMSKKIIYRRTVGE